MPEADNQREFTRAPVHIQAQVVAPNQSVRTGSVSDVSLNGVFISCPDPLPVETACEVTLWLEASAQTLSITASGKVVRADDSGMALQFDVIAGDESFHHLRNLVLHNAAEPDQVEAEFDSHQGIQRRPPH